MFIYQPTFRTFLLKVDKGSEYLIAWKSKQFGYKIKVQFSNTPVVMDKHVYATNILNADIMYHKDYLDYF